MKIKFFFLCLILASSIFAQLPMLKPEVVELYRQQDIAVRSRVSNSNDFIEKHEAFFNHPLFCEIAFGIEYIRFAEVLLVQGKYKKAEEYLLKATKSHYMNTSNLFTSIFDKRKITDSGIVLVVPNTPENTKFKETVLEKIQDIEKKRIVDPRITAVAAKLYKLEKRDQAALLLGREVSNREDSINKVFVAIVEQLKNLIEENPDIDVLRIHTRSYGWTEVDWDASLMLWHVFKGQAAEVAWTDFFEAYFRKRAEEGKGLDYCLWYDTYRFFAKQKGSYYGILPFRNTPFRLNVDNLNEINENRAKVGLLPLSR
jgi:hypothetical protein